MSRVDTTLPADAAEFCPSPHALQIFVVGTYQLEDLPVKPDGQPDDTITSARRVSRWGKCLVYETDESRDQCVKLHEIPMAAVLDMKWASDILAVADAEGHVILRRWQDDTRKLEHVQTLTCHDGSTDLICLSLDWAKHRCDLSSDKISASFSNGLILIALQSNAGLTVTDTWVGHEFEPWITAWDRWDQNFLYTGGDDCTLKGWDLRTGFCQPASLNKRFDAGVTTIQSNPHLQYTLAVGSYDSTVRLFDTRQLSRPVTHAQVGGGAWRVKWHPDAARKHHLLVACMHDGFKVVDFDPLTSNDTNPSCSWRISARFDRHESLAYGVDWSHAPASEKGSLIASCSFYDHSLHLWRA
ncbi:WD40-repeat-containing domain protein [Gautieria morchelliformis]|nr:WD40-repeat-containing domain protein [Gautieria morchelliformis]